VGQWLQERRQWGARIAVIADIAVIARDRKSKTVNHMGHEGTRRRSGDPVIARDPVIGTTFNPTPT
jgi:hypothetical protein